MLVLSRQLNETVMIGKNVQVKVLAVEGTKVLLGFNAPRSVPVHRQEVYEVIQRMKHKPINDSHIKARVTP